MKQLGLAVFTSTATYLNELIVGGNVVVRLAEPSNLFNLVQKCSEIVLQPVFESIELIVTAWQYRSAMSKC